MPKLKLYLLEKNIIQEELIDSAFEVKKLPYIQPINDSQYIYSKQFWPLSYLPTTLSKVAYTHSKEEQEEITKVINQFLSFNKKEGIFSILYDPVNKKIIGKSKSDDKYNPINHSIMQLIDGFSKQLISCNKSESQKSESKFLGVKNEKSPYIDYLDSIDPDVQYYLEKFYVITLVEPCFLCAMAMVHSRVDRVYFLNEDLKQGAMVSKLKINNYNLNHSYLIFKVKSL
jgi:tRNA-specific adenosine deaminase 3